MERNPPIRITENDRKEYARMVRNARAKINRLEKQLGKENLEKSGIDLRAEMPTPKIDEFATRKEFNAWKEKQEDFTNRYNIDYKFVQNQHDIVMSRRRQKRLEEKNRREIRVATDKVKKLEDLEFREKGVVVGTVKDRTEHMKEGAILGIRVPEVFDFDKVTHKSRLDTIERNMSKRTSPEYYDGRQVTLQENFITALQGSFNGEEDELVELIKKMPPDDFYELWLGESDMEFSIYDSDGQEVTANEGHIERITGYVQNYFKGDVNLDLKDF